MQNLTDIAIFVKVVELSSFTAAADALEMSQPVVSKAVTRLEEKLGARLLNRTTRRLSLTEAGSELYRRSVRALAEIENAEFEVARFQTEPRGLLRVSAPMSFSILQLGPAMQAFLDALSRRHGRAEPRRSPGRPRGGRLRCRGAHRPAAGLESDRAQDHAVPAGAVRLACLSRASAVTPERPEDLLEHNCILYSLLSAPREWRLIGPDGEMHVVPINGTLQSNNGLVNRSCRAGWRRHRAAADLLPRRAAAQRRAEAGAVQVQAAGARGLRRLSRSAAT